MTVDVAEVMRRAEALAASRRPTPKPIAVAPRPEPPAKPKRDQFSVKQQEAFRFWTDRFTAREIREMASAITSLLEEAA